mgnify:FL=1
MSVAMLLGITLASPGAFNLPTDVFRLDAVVDGVTNTCFGATQVQFNLGQGRLSWWCGAPYGCYLSTNPQAVQLTGVRLLATCTAVNPGRLFANGFE